MTMQLQKYVFLLCIISSSRGIKIDGQVANSTTTVFELDVALTAGGTHTLLVEQVPAAAQYLLVQAHVQHAAVTLSQVTAAGPERVSGAHVGVVVRLAPAQTTASVDVISGAVGNVTAFVVVSVYQNDVPLPGGCSQTESVPVAPFIRVQTVADAYAHFTVPRAQLGINRRTAFTCNSARSAMRYQAYTLYSADIRSDYQLFRATIARMLTLDAMRNNGIAVSSRDPWVPLRYTFALYRSHAEVYGVAVSVPGQPDSAAAYVPTVHHHCGLLGVDIDPSCPPESLSLLVVLVGCWLLAGAALLTLAVGSLALQVFVTTLVLTAGTVVPLFRRFVWDQPDAAVYAGSLVGLLPAVLLVRRWTWGHASRSTVLLPTFLLFGVSLAAALVSLPLLQTSHMTSDLVFWPALFLATTIAVGFVVLPCISKVSVVVRCALGSLWVTVAVSFMAGGVYQYLFINLVRRVLYPQFRFASVQWPLAAQDIACTAVLGVLFVVSLVATCALRLPTTTPRGEADRLPFRLPVVFPPADYWDRAERAPLVPGRGRRPSGGGSTQYGSLDGRSLPQTLPGAA